MRVGRAKLGMSFYINGLAVIAEPAPVAKRWGLRRNSGGDQKKGAQDETFAAPALLLAGSRVRTSPFRVSECVNAPAASSTTANPRQAPTRRRAGTAPAAFTTTPRRDTM